MPIVSLKLTNARTVAKMQKKGEEEGEEEEGKKTCLLYFEQSNLGKEKASIFLSSFLLPLLVGLLSLMNMTGSMRPGRRKRKGKEKPNQQRTRNELPTELRRRRFVNKAPTGHTNRRKTCEKRVCNVYIFRPSSHFCTPPLVVGKGGTSHMLSQVSSPKRESFSPRKYVPQHLN